ncbi:hypothetical protein [Daejeonella sp.]|uniref:hypothetical protein n=1 Tax=Daejeonella sp. TaxID=2805397 RepID=UPI0025B92B73|nr:hypothetical protein [Daejeonella sp.]
MKTLNLKEMEVIEGGGMNQRNCGISGACIAIGVIAGFASFGLGWKAAGACAAIALAGDCF